MAEISWIPRSTMWNLKHVFLKLDMIDICSVKYFTQISFANGFFSFDSGLEEKGFVVSLAQEAE